VQQSGFRFFQDLFGNIGRRVRLGVKATPVGTSTAFERLLAACSLLLTDLGEASKITTAKQALTDYELLNDTQRVLFFKHLHSDFGVNSVKVRAAYEQWDKADESSDTFNKLFSAVEPKRQALLRQLNSAPGATTELMKMRADLLSVIANNASIAVIDADFVHVFRSWFNRGFLVLRRIDWDTPASILEKIVQYEAVHKINGWDDLRRRLDATDRRCYGFFHPATRGEPLIFVEVALCNGVASAVAPLLASSQQIDQTDVKPFDTAIFYSISNCQQGLKGISFGNFLLKQVVLELSLEMPQLRKFATLSPVPGFAKWLAGQAQENQQLVSLVSALAHQDWHEDEALQAMMRPQLLHLTATYIATAKSKKNTVSDPVAKFHLGNGACVDAIHWPADLSTKGLSESFGVMINYWYEVDEIEARHEAFVQQQAVALSPKVKTMLAAKPNSIKGVLA